MLMKRVGLVAFLTLSVLVAAAVGSATAAETTLCKTGTDTPYCKTAAQYSPGTLIQTSSTNLVISNALVSVSCESSLFEAETNSQTGEPLPMTLVSLEFEGCEGSNGAECTVEGKTPNPENVSLERTTSWNGTLTFKEASARIFAKCGPYINCEWAAPAMDVHSSDADLTFHNGTMTKLSGSLCPSQANIASGSYLITSPTNLFVARPGSPPPVTTSMCKGFELYCEPGNLYAKGTELKGTSTDFTINTPEKYGGGTFTCANTSLVAKSEAEYAEPLPVSTTEFLPSECKFSGIPNSCETKANGGYSGAVSRYNADGRWSGGKASWIVTCGSFLYCTFTTKPSPIVAIEHGNPGAIRFTGVSLEVSGNLICPESASLSATFPLSGPSGPLYFSDVLR